MTKQTINLGLEPSGIGGDKNREANVKNISNFNELYAFLGATGVDLDTLPSTLPILNGGTGANSSATARTNLEVYSKDESTQEIKNSILNNLTTGGLDKSLSAEMGKNLQTNKLDKTANAASASKLATARTFSWTGDATGSVAFDGTANIANALTLSTTGVIAGVYGSNVKTTTLTLDAKGRVTSALHQDIRAATTALSGIVQLNDTLTSTLTTQAATANAVKKVNDAVLAADIIAKASIPSNQKGIANGVATLDSSGVIPAGQLPSYVDDVLEFATLAVFPAIGESGKIYISIETGLTYRWTGTVYVSIGGGAGVSDSALRLFNARTIALSGGVTGTATPFDGSANITIPITEIDGAKITKGIITAARIPTLNQSTTGNAATATTATKLATARKINGKDFDGTADIEFDGGGIFIGTPLWVNINRANVYDGFITSDGQLLNRADFPDLWAAVAANVYAKTTDAAWLTNPTLRASYTDGNGSTTFRVPDLNGFQFGSFKGLYARGDGYNNRSGSVLNDAIRNITGLGGYSENPNVFEVGRMSGAFYSDTSKGWRGASSATDTDNSALAFDASRVVPTDDENRPVSAVGVWLIRARGATMPMPAEGSPATLLANSFNGSQSITGNLTVTGLVNADILPNMKAALSASGLAPIFACRAWVNFNGVGVVTINASGNVSSITDNGVGDYTVNLIVPMPHINYSVSTSSVEYADGTPIAVSLRFSGAAPILKTVSAFRLSARSPYSGGFLDLNSQSLQVVC